MITLWQSQINHINQIITIAKSTLCLSYYINSDQFDYINQMTTLSVITLSRFLLYCNKRVPDRGAGMCYLSFSLSLNYTHTNTHTHTLKAEERDDQLLPFCVQVNLKLLFSLQNPSKHRQHFKFKFNSNISLQELKNKNFEEMK